MPETVVTIRTRSNSIHLYVDITRSIIIKVERSGPAHSLKAAPALGGFEELVERLPEVLRENLKLMRYTEPTPIQAHAVPLAMNGYQSHYLTAD